MENENATSNHPVLSALNGKITELLNKISDLELELSKAHTRISEMNSYRARQEQELQELLIEGLTDETIDSVAVNSIADVFGLTLERRIVITATYNVEACFLVPFGTDPDEIANGMGISTEFHGEASEYLETDHWELDDYNIEEV